MIRYAAFLGDGEGDAACVLVGPDDAAERVHLEHAVDVDGESHFHGVGFFVGEGFHADDGFAFLDDRDAPVDALLAAAFDFNGL